MKIEFNILWFDDTHEYFDSLDLSELKEEIRGWGFEPKIDFVITADEFRARAPYDGCDLIVMDFDLKEFGHGQEFIAAVRNQDVFTEIIFYSSVPADQLWDEVFRMRLEGVYIAARPNILARIEQIGRHTVSKVLDLENMRGIVMAEVGDLDLLLDRILIKAINSADETQRAKLFKGFCEHTTETIAANSEALMNFKDAPDAEKLVALCDSDKRWQNYQRVARFNKALKDANPGNFREDVLAPRNFLAHGVPTKADDGTVTFLYRGKPYVFSAEVGAALRQRILRYKSSFSALHETL